MLRMKNGWQKCHWSLNACIRARSGLELASSVQFSSVLSHVRLFVTPRTAVRQPSLSITNTRSLLKLMSIALVMPSNHLILCHPLLLPPSIFVSQFFASGGQRIGVSASASVLPVNIQGQFPLIWTDWISLQSKGLSSPTPQFKSINSLALSFLYSPTLTSIHDYWKKS